MNNLPHELLASIDKHFEKIMTERDEDRGQLYDAADNDAAYEHQLQLDRERETYDALEACVAAGIDKKHLKVLSRETGMTTWALEQSLKG